MYPWEELVSRNKLTQDWIDFLNEIKLGRNDKGTWTVEYQGETKLVDFAIVNFLPGIAVKLSKPGEPFQSFFIAVPGMDCRIVTRGSNIHKSLWLVWDQGEE